MMTTCRHDNPKITRPRRCNDPLRHEHRTGHACKHSPIQPVMLGSKASDVKNAPTQPYTLGQIPIAIAARPSRKRPRVPSLEAFRRRPQSPRQLP
jgi:hypothetical protein